MENNRFTYCKIINNQVWLNENLFFQSPENEELAAFLSALYKHLDLAYPKFFKMDKLSKLGVLAAELIIRNNAAFQNTPKNEIALVFANSASSLDSDRNHQKTISDKQNYFPSPAVFVYTLPNIVLGEIAIKHKFTGENAFFVSEHFSAEQLCFYADLLLQTTPTNLVICAWVNVDENKSEAFVYCLEKTNFSEEKKDLTNVIQQLYQHGNTRNR